MHVQAVAINISSHDILDLTIHLMAVENPKMNSAYKSVNNLVFATVLKVL
jgi:hypothetical protein